MRTLLVVYDGVLADECQAFRSVLSLLDGGDVVTVAAERRPYRGPGGAQVPDATFDEIVVHDEDETIVVVPGGIGCERATDDPALRDFLRRTEHSARYVAASSTGSVVLASAGLLHGRPAATHWLAADLLRRFGSEADGRRLVVAGNIVTCEGRISALEAAFTIVGRVAGPDTADRIRATLLERGRPLLERSTWRRRRRSGVSPHRPTTTPDAAVTPIAVMVELVDDDETRRRLRRAQHRRR